MVEAVVGWPGSGLTRACIERYGELVDDGCAPERIIFLVKTHAQVVEATSRLQKRLPGVTGPLQVETFFGFTVRLVGKFWEEIRAQRPDLPLCFEPLVLSPDLNQYCFEHATALCPDHGTFFEACGLQDYWVWEQIGSAATIGAASGLAVEAIGPRLSAAWPDPEDAPRRARLGAIGCCLKRARAQALDWGALDAGLATELFAQVVLKLPDFWRDYDHLIADRLEDSSALELAFFEQCVVHLQSLFLAFGIGGGQLPGSVPALAAALVARKTRFRYLEGSFKGHPALVWVGDRVARTLSAEFKNPLLISSPDAPPPVQLLEAQTQVEAAEQTLTEIRALLASGVLPAQIAVIAPIPDAALSTVLVSGLGAMVCVLRPFPALVKYPLVRALLSVLELAHPEWGLFPSFSEARLMLNVLLDIDPVRSELLTADVLDPVERALRPPQAVRYPERVGFSHLQRFAALVDWLDAYQSSPALSIEHCLSRLFAEVLAEYLLDPEDQALLQVLIDSARRFQALAGDHPGRRFLTAIRSGQTPDRANQPTPGALVVSTPLTYINQGLSADYQFWFDTTAERWTRSTWYTLYNPRVLTPEWNGERFDERQDRRERHLRLAKTVFNLCCRTGKQLHLVRSVLNARGEVNTGELDQLVRRVVQEPQ